MKEIDIQELILFQSEIWDSISIAIKRAGDNNTNQFQEIMFEVIHKFFTSEFVKDEYREFYENMGGKQ